MAICDKLVKKPLPAAAILLGLAITGAACVGCSKGNAPPLGSVTGTITLDSQPLSDADVTFQPEGPGRAAVGTTDEQGHYELIYLNDVEGATVGPNRVMITTARDGADDGSTPSMPERLPARYHSQSDVKVEVVEGSNTFDFDLQSQ